MSSSARFKRAAHRRAGRAAFLDWWGAELASLVPSGTRLAVERRRTRPVIAFDAGFATLWLPVMRDGALAMESASTIPLTGERDATIAAGRAALAAVPRALRGGSGVPRVVVALPGRQTLRRTLTLPAALEENLKQALAYDLDRHTPFKSDELYFDVDVTGRDAAQGTIEVALVAARRAIVDQALAHVDDWGAHTAAIVPESPERASGSRLNLLPDARRPQPGRGKRWQVAVPLVVLAIAGGIALALPIWQKREYAIALNRQVDAARVQAAASDALRTDLDRLTGDYNFALERKFAFPSTLQVLDEVTKLLPDDTWLTQMEVKTTTRGKETQRELLLRGESGNAGRLITLFEESKAFTQAAPRSPTTKIQPGPGEIFDLVAQLRALPMPAPAIVAAAPSPKPAADAGTPAPSPAPPKPAPPPAPAPPSAAQAPPTPAPAPPPQGAPNPAALAKPQG
ncbi:MAG TPA: pilus assembly protein PilM [Casimicrobiaceae bacterium]|nr:pilus assembly protein PilM [Casimicrobiaceae bacterium]